MQAFYKHITRKHCSVKEALGLLNLLASDAILFIIDENDKLIGSLTDGDLRRGFIEGLGFDDSLLMFMHKNPKLIKQGHYDLNEIILLRQQAFSIFPVVNEYMEIVNVVNFKYQKSYLPLDAVIMAGGRGERLRPLTDEIPKPLLVVGEKPIIEHNIDRLNSYGIDDIWISIKYLGNQIIDFFGDGKSKSIRIKYLFENEPLGTAGALSMIDSFIHDDVLVMNSDLLTNIDFEDFYLFYKELDADFAVGCIPYNVDVPYAVMETDGKFVKSFKEKPTYTHYSNAGIYLMKKKFALQIPKNQRYDATDLMQRLIDEGKKVVAYPIVGYWLDIGKHEDFKKAQIDIKLLKL